MSKNELLRNLELAMIGSCHCLTKTPKAEHHKPECLYRILSEARAALTQPAQPAEGGEAWAKTASELNHFAHTGKWPEDSTAPPASQEQALTVIDPEEWEPCTPEYLSNGGDCKAPRVWHAATCNHWHPKREPRQEQAQQPSRANLEAAAKVCDGFAAPDMAAALRGQQPDHVPDAGKMAQQPSGGEVVDEIRHLLDETWGFAATPPRGKDNISAALDLLDTLTLATPKPEPMTDGQADALFADWLDAAGLIWLGISDKVEAPTGTTLSKGDVIQLIRATEAHYGITKEQA